MSIDYEILYEDKFILAVNKPSGTLSAPDRYDTEALVLSRELEMIKGKIWAVYRLDCDTSGVQLFARDEETHRALDAAFAAHEIERKFHVIVHGRPSWTDSQCDYPLMPDGDRLHRTIIDGTGKKSLTKFHVLGLHGKLAVVEATPITSRTHQIRIHLAALEYPVCADVLYGDGKPIYLSRIKKRWKGEEETERPLISRAAIHAFSVSFKHPQSGEIINIEAPYPKDFRALYKQLQKI